MRIVSEALRRGWNLDFIEDFDRPLLRFPPMHLAVSGDRLHDLVPDREDRVQRGEGLLEHDRYRFAAQRPYVLLGQSTDVLAVKQHLANLYDKFGVPAGDDHRRARLANEALRRGAVSLSELEVS